MKPTLLLCVPQMIRVSRKVAVSIALPLLLLGLLMLGSPIQAQVIIRSGSGPSSMPPGMGMPGGSSGPMSSPGSSSGNRGSGNGPWIPSESFESSITGTNAADLPINSTNLIQISFQGANIDMIAQWLAQTTGKAVIKHPRVQCQLTIISSQKVTAREGVNMIYRALALEGYSAIETGMSILIVPADQEPNMSPALVESSMTNVPAGRQRLVKVFQLHHLGASDVKDRIKSALTDKATVDVDELGNRIIVTDYNDNLRLVGELIDALDTDNPDAVSVRVLPLKNIASDQLAKELAPLYQKMSGGSGDHGKIDVAADDRSNSLIVLSSRADFLTIQKLVAMLDTEDAQEKTTQTFILKNADAQDVAKQLQDLSQSQAPSTPRYPFFFSSSQPSTDTKKIGIVADRRRNAVIVQAPPTQMASITKMIEELDEPITDGSLAPKIYPLKYVSASDMEDVLNELFLKKQQQRSYFDYFYGNDSDSSSSSSQDAGRLYGKVRITSEPYSNAIIVTSNSKENLAVVENVLNQLDQPSQAGESTLRVGLKYAKADTVANSLNILFAKNGSPALHPVTAPSQNNNNNNQNSQQAQSDNSSQSGFDLEQETKVEGYFPWLGGQPDNTRSSDSRSSARAVSDLVGRVRTVSDQRGNALLISANVHFFPQILKLVEDLDAPADQVSIEARIVEVSSDFLDKLGVRWSPDGSQVFTADDYDNSILASGSGSYQKGFGGNTTVNTPAAASATAVQTLASLRSGVVGSTLNIDYLVQFMRKHTDATVLGEPSITIDNNEMGKLFVGQQVPVPQNTQVSSVGSQNTSISYKDVGVVLEVTPHINSNGEVQLKIHAESSTVVAGETVLGGDVFDTRNFRTEVTAKSGETLVLGGIIQKQVNNVVRKVPILGDIPLLGWLFKKKDKDANEVELMVFLSPKIIHSADEARELLKDVNQRTPELKQWEQDAKPDKKH